jgi:hypothetical protein
MRKIKTLTFLTVLILALSLTTVAFASKDENNGKHLAKGKQIKTEKLDEAEKHRSPVEHLYLYEKDPETWEIVEDGAVGKLTILTHKDKYIFNARGLELEMDYSLMNYAPGTDWSEETYPNPWPGEDSTEIGKDTSNEEGTVHMKGDWDTATEGKIWLVLDADFDTDLDPSQMIGWSPTRYLFEYELLQATE